MTRLLRRPEPGGALGVHDEAKRGLPAGVPLCGEERRELQRRGGVVRIALERRLEERAGGGRVAAAQGEERARTIGLVALAYELSDAAETSETNREALQRSLTWLEDHLEVPDRFNRTKSKGWYRRATRGLSWLRASAADHLAAMRSLADVVSRCGYIVEEIRASRVGYVIYEDDAQVVAEPFRDTRTR